MSDTLVSYPSGATARMSKLHYIAHANLVLTGQGQPLFLAALAFHLQMISMDFDNVVEAWGEILAEVRGLAARNRSPYVGAQRILLVGYSAIAGRFRALMTQIPSVDAKPLFVTQAQWCFPWEENWEDFPPVDLRYDALLGIARYQIRKGREQGVAGTGGPVIVAQMMREQTVLRTLETAG